MGRTIVLQWISAHMEVDGNEGADKLMKKGMRYIKVKDPST